jgi:pilus assembly protein Flp/PilA
MLQLGRRSTVTWSRLCPELLIFEAPVIRIAYAFLTRIRPNQRRAPRREFAVSRAGISGRLDMSKIYNFLRNEHGASMVEYSILIGIITAAAIASIITIGGKVSDAWSTLVGAWT